MPAPRLALIDYDAGNLPSITRALTRAGAEVTVIREPVAAAWDGIVLPGVGAYGAAMARLTAAGFTSWLRRQVRSGTPLVGVCLGMQLLYEWSAEGGTVPGLALLRGDVQRLASDVKIPHMGWNSLTIRGRAGVLDGIPDGAYVYFVHSYIVTPRERDDVVATTSYGAEFPAVVVRDRLVGLQFHPEKSGEIGLRIIRNIVGWVAARSPRNGAVAP